MTDLTLDFNSNVAMFGELVVFLSPTEMDVINTLHEHGDRFCPSSKLDRDVWGKSTIVTRHKRVMSLRRLRAKLASIDMTVSKNQGMSAGYRIERKP